MAEARVIKSNSDWLKSNRAVIQHWKKYTQVLPGNVEALVRWGKKIKHL